MKIKAYVDADSIAYEGGTSPTEEEMRIAINHRISIIRDDTGADELQLYLEEWRKPKENFRLAVFNLSNEHRPEDKQGYKGNRKSMAKPKLLDEAREFMRKYWKAKVVLKRESEDQVIIDAYREIDQFRPIICCIDKDLLQHALTFYNYKTGEILELSEEQAQVNLWRQVCTGDSTDNIPGIPRVGKKKAEQAVTSSEDAMFQAAKLYVDKGLEYEYFIEQYNLIYIRKENHTKLIRPITEKQYKELQDAS